MAFFFEIHPHLHPAMRTDVEAISHKIELSDAQARTAAYVLIVLGMLLK